MSFVVGNSTDSEYRKGQFTRQPDRQWNGTASPLAQVNLGGWTKDNEMQCEVVVNGSVISMTPVANEDKVNLIVQLGTRPTTVYYMINTGTDSRSTDWTIMFDVYSSPNPDTEYNGQWKFTKSKGSEDDAYGG